MGQRVGYPAAVTDNIQSLMSAFQMLIQLHFHIIELHLNAIKQRIVIGRTRRNLIQCINPSRIRFGSTRLKSPGVAERVGSTSPSSILFALLLRPLTRSPKRCTMTPPPSILESLAILSPYPLLSLKGSEKCLETSRAKFVFSVCLSAPS